MKLFIILSSCLIVFGFSHVDAHKNLIPDYSGVRAVTVSIDPPVQAVADPPSELARAGFSPDQVQLMLHLGQAESGMRIDALGDIQLQTNVWGPSIGYYQIRTLKTPQKGCRDIEQLRNNGQAQANCAFQIYKSQGFNAWTTYQNGVR